MEILDVIERFTGFRVSVRILGQRPSDPSTLVADCSLAQATLCCRASRTLDNIVSTEWAAIGGEKKEGSRS